MTRSKFDSTSRKIIDLMNSALAVVEGAGMTSFVSTGFEGCAWMSATADFCTKYVCVLIKQQL